MAKLILNDITSGFASNELYNNNNDAIEAALENTLSRDGATPNMMNADFDLNSHDILNGGSADFTDLSLNGTNVVPTDLATSTLPDQTSNAGKFLSTNGSTASWEDISLIHDTVADMKADASLAPGDLVFTKGYTTIGDGGGATYLIVLSQAADGYGDHTLVSTHVAVLQAAGVYKLRQYGLVGDGSTDDSTALQALFTALVGSDAVVDTETYTYVIDEPVSLASANKYKFIGVGTFKLGTSFAEGGSNTDLHVMTLTGLAPRTVTTTNLFYNYWKEASVSDTPKGTRVLISDDDAANYWDVGDNDYRNSLQTFVDYADTANGIINFHPEINFPVALDDVPTKEIDDTDIIVLIYEDDIEVVMESGIKFQGDLNTLATYRASAYAKGLLVKRGKFRILADFNEISDCLRVEEAICYYSGTMQGGYSASGGNGVKVVQGSTQYVDNSTITGFRHAIAIAGSTQDGASGYISNCVLTDAKQAYDANTYPNDESRALDGHGNCQVLQVVNCDIRGAQTGGGVMSITKSKIHSESIPPIEIRGGDTGDNGEIYINDCDVLLSADIPSSQDVVAGGAGTFNSTIYFMEDGGLASVASGWKVTFSSTRFSATDATNYPASTILHLEPGNVDLARFSMRNGCEFKFGGTNIREIAIDPKVVNGSIDLGDTKFLGCGVSIGLRNTTGTTWADLTLNGTDIRNIDGTAGQSFSQGLVINGDTTVDSNNRFIKINGANIESIGATAGISMNACCWEGVSIINTDVLYTATSGTLGYAIRTHRNQNVTTSDHFVSHVDLNTVNNAAATSGASITTGIQILGLDASGGLASAFYATGSNSVRGATTNLSTTGTAVTKV